MTRYSYKQDLSRCIIWALSAALTAIIAFIDKDFLWLLCTFCCIGAASEAARSMILSKDLEEKSSRSATIIFNN